MKNLNSYITERLHITKQTKPITKNLEKFGDGEIKRFSECDPFRIERGINRGKEWQGQNLIEEVTQYIKPNDLVYEVVLTNDTGVIDYSKIPLSTRQTILSGQCLMQKINLLQYQQGYTLKRFDGQLVLVIKYTNKSKIYKVRYIFKI